MEGQVRRYTRRFILSASATTLGSVLTSSSRATAADHQPIGYPVRAITIVVPFAPGGGTDIVARMLATELSQRWKGSVIVENKPGAGGQIGTSFVARSAPDGYTLMLGITTLIQAPGLYKNLPYDVFKDLTPLAQLATSVNFLVVPASSPATSFKDFIAYVKSRPGTISFGSNGNAGTSHLHGAMLNALQKLDMVHVPFSGSAPLLTSLMGKQVDCAFVDIAPLRPQVASGKLRMLAVTGPKRSLAFPDVPTLEELGVSGFEPVGWFALFGPAGLPIPIREQISASAVQVMRSPEAVRRLEELGLTPSRVTAVEFADSLRPDMQKWQKMIQVGNVRVD